MTQVDHFDLGKCPSTDATRQGEQCVLPRCRVDPRFDRWSCASEHDNGAIEPRANHRELARVVSRIFTLLVTRFVLLVDDDRTEVVEGCEDRRARTDRYALVSPLESEPCVVSLPVTERGMKHGNAIAEYGAKPVDGLRRQGDLRDEHDRGFSSHVHDLAKKLDVYERLAAASDSVKEKDVPGRTGFELRDCIGLRLRWLVPRRAIGRTRRKRISVDSF